MIASHRIVCERCVYRLWKKLTRRSCNKIVGLTSLVKKTMKNKVVIVLPWKSFLMILSLTKQLSPSPLADSSPGASFFVQKRARNANSPFSFILTHFLKAASPSPPTPPQVFFSRRGERETRITIHRFRLFYFLTMCKVTWPYMCVEAQSKTSEVTSGENVISFKTAGNIAKQSYFETTPWPRP